MRIVTWNCNGAFRKKAKPIAEFKPDIAVIQECEQLDRLLFMRDIPQPTSQLWFGDNPNRGLGIFSYTDIAFECAQEHDQSIRFCVPLRTKERSKLNLIAVWAMDHQDPKLSYVGQLFKAVQRYAEFIGERDTIMIGDFNSNKQWDRKSRIGNHSAVVANLADQRLTSLYHAYFNEAQGDETQPTFYLYRKLNKPYHIDYCFLPNHWVPRATYVSVGSHADWSQFSDHSPLFAEFD